MPRLLILSRSSNPRGGADRIIADLCRKLPAKGWSVCLGLTRGQKFNDPDAYRAEYPDLPIRELDARLGLKRERLQSIQSLIHEVEPDVVLSMRVFDACEAVGRCKRIGRNGAPRLVVGVRAFEAPYLADVRSCAAVIDGCVTSGKLIARACVSHSGMESERVFSIAGGVESPLKTRSRTAPGQPVRLLYAGRLEQAQKRAQDLIPFVAQLSDSSIDFRLTVAGDGPEQDALRRGLQPWIDRGLVHLCGWVDRDRLYQELYPASDIFLHFAGWEGVTIAPRESMAHGVVPVISRFTGLVTEGQFEHESNALTFPVGDTQAAVDQVVRLVRDHELFARLSAAAEQSQSGEYSAAGAITKWDQSLRRILALPAKTGACPTVPESLPGRLTGLGVPISWQSRLRQLMRRPVQHRDPGSEWPTSSGLMTEAERSEIDGFAHRLESDVQ